MFAEHCAYSTNTHLACFRICMRIQIASFTTATLPGVEYRDNYLPILHSARIHRAVTPFRVRPYQQRQCLQLSSSLRPRQWQGPVLTTQQMFA